MSDGLRKDVVAASGPLAEYMPSAASSLCDSNQRDWLKIQQAVVAIGRRAIAPPSLSVLMHDSAALIADMLDVECFATAEPQQDSEVLLVTLNMARRDGASPQTFTQRIGSDMKDSLVRHSLQVMRPLAVDDFLQGGPVRDSFLEEHGIRSAAAAPLITDCQSHGVLVACSRDPCRFETEDLLCMETVAHLVSTTIARSRSEKALAEERRLASGVLQATGALVLVLDEQGRITDINASVERATGFSPAEIRNRPIWNVFSAPGEAGGFRAALEKLSGGASRIKHECTLLTKHSERRTVAWSCAAVPGIDGPLESIVATGVDVTGRREAEQRAERAEKDAEAADRLAKMNCGVNVVQDERRRGLRRSYPYHQMVAPIIKGTLPRQSEFTRVCCQDIAAGGFSYLASEPPLSNSLIVALGSPPNLIHVAAQVVHVTRVERGGKNTYLVGCGYTGRASY